MSFHDVLFPPRISLGATGGPEFLTRVITTGAGHEFRNINWDQGRGRWNVAHGVKEYVEFQELNAFFRARRGKAYGFRFKDWFDYRAEQDPFGIGDGSTKLFQLKRLYDDGLIQVSRIITKPANPAVYTDADPFALYANGVGVDPLTYTVDWNKGQVTFATAPASGVVLSWSGEHHLPARFDTDSLNATLVEYDVYDWGDIPVVELRPEEVLEA